MERCRPTTRSTTGTGRTSTRSGRSVCAIPTAPTTTCPPAGSSSATSAATTPLPPRRRSTSARREPITAGRTAKARAPAPARARSTPIAHNGRDASITGGFVYHGTQFPSSYQGSYFFADYAQNWIKRLTLRRERERQRRLQLRTAGRLLRRPLRRHRVPHGGARRRALLHRSRLLRHQRHIRRQQDPPDSLSEREPGADRGRRRRLPALGRRRLPSASRAPARPIPRARR